MRPGQSSGLGQYLFRLEFLDLMGYKFTDLDV